MQVTIINASHLLIVVFQVVAMSMSSIIANYSLVWFAHVRSLPFAALQPCRCHHECSLMVVRSHLSMQMSSIIANYSLVAVRCRSRFGGCSWFAELQPFRCHHDSSLMVWFSHGVVPGGGHVDVIMNVRSWCGSLMFVFVVL